MRLLHTADWHLGRLFHGLHLTEDQRHVLDQFIDLAREVRPDVIPVSGDIYDRAVPPPEAVELLDEVLARLVGDLGIHVVLIAGNHDSPHRLGFCSRLLAQNGLHIVGDLPGSIGCIPFADDHGPVSVYALPYAEPPVIRERLQAEGVVDHNDAMRACVGEIERCHPPGTRAILVGHAFVAGGTESESERPLSIGGAGTVDCACFNLFDYVALGHLHRCQSVGRDNVWYSGSLMKYSFSEVGDTKSVSIVDMDAKGVCTVETVSLKPRRDLRRIEGYLRDLIEHPESGPARDDYLLVTLMDNGALLDAMGKLRQVYPNVLHLERPALDVTGELRGPASDHRQIGVDQLFASFFEQVTTTPLEDEQKAAFAKVIGDMERREREAAR